MQAIGQLVIKIGFWGALRAYHFEKYNSKPMSFLTLFLTPFRANLPEYCMRREPYFEASLPDHFDEI